MNNGAARHSKLIFLSSAHNSGIAPHKIPAKMNVDTLPDENTKHKQF